MIKSPDEYSVVVETSRGPKDFQYDQVFTPEHGQEKVFEDTNVSADNQHTNSHHWYLYMCFRIVWEKPFLYQTNLEIRCCSLIDLTSLAWIHFLQY